MKKYSLPVFLLFTLLNHSIFAANFALESPAFKLNTMIPVQYTCTGADTSPPITWHDAPANTQSLALVVDDPDASSGVWTHWILFNIPTAVTKIDAGGAIPTGAANGLNSWGSIGYRGPCPSIGVHRYVFKLYALDKILNFKEGTSKDIILQAMTGHVIGSSELTGLYQK